MKTSEVKCDECGKVFVQTRVDKHFCSGRCKSLHFRRTQRERLEHADQMLDKLLKENQTAA